MANFPKLKLPIVICFMIFGALVLFSNHDDWDQFLTFFEVDLRSWLIDGKPPVWSYQLCAGSTRIGDPQAFGLSPVFLPILLFGSFLGSKVLVLGSFVIGFFYTRKIMLLACETNSIPRAEAEVISCSLPVFLLFGNSLLWSIHKGHLTYVMMPLLSMVFYYTYLGITRPINVFEGSILAMSVFAYASGGFYHSLVFFLLPIIFISLFFFSVSLFLWPKLMLSFFCKPELLRVIAWISLGTLLSAYKWIGVLHYQANFPRTAGLERETNFFFHLITYLLAPTFDHLILGHWRLFDTWAIFEYSAFSWISWILLGYFFLGISGVVKFMKSKIDLFFGLAFAIVVCLAMGDDALINLHKLINHYLYHDSVRVVGRYHFLLTVILAAYIVVLVLRDPKFRQIYLKFMVLPGFLITVLSLVSFIPLLDLEKFSILLNGSISARAEMNTIVFVPNMKVALVSDSYMYPAIRMGGIVANCYQPISREQYVAREREIAPGIELSPDGLLGLVDGRFAKVSDECRDSVFLTQNEVFFSRSKCPEDFCLHINMGNLYRAGDIFYNEERKLYCRR